MTVGDLIEKLGSFDASLLIKLGADGAILGQAKSVYIVENLEDELGKLHAEVVIIAEWEWD